MSSWLGAFVIGNQKRFWRDPVKHSRSNGSTSEIIEEIVALLRIQTELILFLSGSISRAANNGQAKSRSGSLHTEFR
jgi:hypothetical protein